MLYSVSFLPICLKHWKNGNFSTKLVNTFYEAYSESCQTSKMKPFVNIVYDFLSVFNRQLFSQNTSSWCLTGFWCVSTTNYFTDRALYVTLVFSKSFNLHISSCMGVLVSSSSRVKLKRKFNAGKISPLNFRRTHTRSVWCIVGNMLDNQKSVVRSR